MPSSSAISPLVFFCAANSTILDRSANLTDVERDRESRSSNSRSSALSSISTATRIVFFQNQETALILRYLRRCTLAVTQQITGTLNVSAVIQVGKIELVIINVGYRTDQLQH
jgi:hypothetical protein